MSDKIQTTTTKKDYTIETTFTGLIGKELIVYKKNLETLPLTEELNELNRAPYIS